MKIKIFFVFLFVLILQQTINGQNSDFSIWYGINAEHSISKKIEFDISAMLRTNSNASMFEQFYLEGGVSYKFNKHLTISGAYRFTEKVEYTSVKYPRHKLFADVKGVLPAGNFTFSSRLRLQFEKKTFITEEADKTPGYQGRIKVKAAYKIPAFFINPYLYVESFSPLFRNSDRLIDKSRFSAGFDIRIAAKHSFEAEYIFQLDNNARKSYINIISLNYNIKF